MQYAVQEKLDSYPDLINVILCEIRALVRDIVHENNLGQLEETLKWGQLSYLVKGGSTVRVDWTPKYPLQYCIYFNCKTKLVDTFREIYRDVFTFDGNRAIVLWVNEPIPKKELRHCIELSLKYKSIKNLPLLGV
ncbi:MAG: DUF1801 domain-containing protein [Gammaproteobacteria bacterium]|nr:DUF1801 domain-containing protein [Gammaproteobacteria bacterium]